MTSLLFKELQDQIIKQNSELSDSQRNLRDFFEKNGQTGISAIQLKTRMAGINNLPLGIFTKGRDFIIWTTLINQMSTDDRSSPPLLTISCTASVLVNGRAIQVLHFQPYESVVSVAEVNKRTTLWVEDILSQNLESNPFADNAITTVNDSSVVWLKEIMDKPKTYSTKGHSKTIDIDISLKYPSSWKAEEGEHPHVVQNFVGPSVSGLLPMFSILVQEWPSDVGKSFAQITEHMNDDEIRSIYEEIASEICKGNSKRLKSGFTKIDGEEAQWLIISQASEKAGIAMHSKCLIHSVILPSGYVSFSGAVLSVDNNAELLDTAFEDYLPLFQQIMLRVIINSKWTKQRDLLQNDPDVTLRSGTGFFITSNGWLVTNAHVTSMGQNFVIKVGESTLPAKVKRIDEANDLALLKVEGQFPALAIERGNTCILGTTVFTVGFPNPELQGFSPKMTKGDISSLAGIKDDPRYFQISVPIQPGNSGGALVDASGNVVGVVTAKISDAAAIEASGAIPQNVNYAIKSVYLVDLIKSIPDVFNGLKEPMKTQDMAVAIQTAEKASVMIICQ